MIMNKNTVLTLAIAGLMGVSVPAAMALGPTSPIQVASETTTATAIPITAVNLFSVPFDIDVSFMAGRVVKSTAQMYVAITLTNGAKFGPNATFNNLKLLCKYQTGGVYRSALNNVQGNGLSSVSFQLVSGKLTAAGPVCKLSAAAALATTALFALSGKTTKGIKVVARHFDPINPTSGTNSGTLVSFTQGARVNLVNIPSNVTIDVRSPSLSTNFVTNLAAPVSGRVKSLGGIQFRGVGGVFTSLGTPVAGGNFLSSANITVSGAPLAAAKTVSGSSGYVFLSNFSACVPAIPGFAGKSATNNVVSFAGLSVFNLDPATTFVCMKANGKTNIQKGQVSVSLSVATGGPNGNGNLSIVDPKLALVRSNGTSMKVLNIPNDLTNAAVEQVYIRIYNAGNSAGNVTGTLYNQTGATIGTANATLASALAAKAVQVVNLTQLLSAFGITGSPSWAGRAWMQVTSELEDMRIQVLLRRPDGSFSEVSEGVTR